MASHICNIAYYVSSSHNIFKLDDIYSEIIDFKNKLKCKHNFQTSRYQKGIKNRTPSPTTCYIKKYERFVK